MEQTTDVRRSSRDQKCVGSAERAIPPRVRHGTKLRDMLMSDKPNLSYAHFHHEITKDPEDGLPKYLKSQQSQVLGRTAQKEDELVRYMSNLPSYLEKGKNYQDKPLNVGVLDWKRLEKWRQSQKQTPSKHNGYSPSSSNTSFFSTDCSSPHSSRGESCSPAHQRVRRFSLQLPLETSPNEVHVQDAKSSYRGQTCSPSRQRMPHHVVQVNSQKTHTRELNPQETDVFGRSTAKFYDSTGEAGSGLSRQQKVFEAFQQSKMKQSDSKTASEMAQRPTFDKFEVAAPWKGKTATKGREAVKETQRLRETNLISSDQDGFKREKSEASMIRDDQSENSCSGATASSDSMVNDKRSVEPGRMITSDRNRVGDPLPSRVDYRNHSEASGSCPWSAEQPRKSSQSSSAKPPHSACKTSTQAVKTSSHSSHMSSFPVRMFSSPSRSRNTEEKKPVAGLHSYARAAKPSEDLDARRGSESIPKARNPSPIRRLSFAMGKMMKNGGSRDNSPVRKSSSREGVSKYGPEGAMASAPADNPNCDKSSANNNRGRSSPLRRLLDPILKSRASNSSEPSKKHSSSANGFSNGQLDLCSGRSVKVKSRSASCSTMSVFDPHAASKIGSSSLQALLQLSFKNGLPLFTFAIDNESDILAATVRKSYVPLKGLHIWTYTFFTVREVKRKSGIWLNQGGKNDGHGYVPNVVAQMKVTDSLVPPFSNQETSVDYLTREFDLFAVDVGNGDQYVTDFHPTNELAAIVVKLPKTTSGNSCKDGQSSYDWLDPEKASLGENLQETSSCGDSYDKLQNQLSLCSLNLGATVILPGGVHTVPSKGEISTLAQRWRSGGSCDCGGWDLGCQLRVYTNQRGYIRKSDSSVDCASENKFQLFPQVGQDNQPMLSFVPFKERIYSVEFDSSLSLLQAFAICISRIDCRRPAEASDPSGNAVDKNANEVGVFELPIRMKMFNNPSEAPARYVSYPPHSPVGRV